MTKIRLFLLENHISDVINLRKKCLRFSRKSRKSWHGYLVEFVDFFRKCLEEITYYIIRMFSARCFTKCFV